MQGRKLGEIKLVRHSLLLSAVMGAGVFANVLFHMAMSRTLSEADYGVLMTMLGVLYVLNVPAETLRTSMAYYTATYRAGEVGGEQIAQLFFQATRRLLLLAIPVLVVLGISAPLFRSFFHLEGLGVVYVTGIVWIATLLLTTLHGVLQGVQEFGWYGASVCLWFSGRVAIAVMLVLWGTRAAGALGGIAAGAGLGMLVPYVRLRETVFRRREVERIDSRPIYRYAIRVLLVFAAFMFLGNVDLIASKHYFSPEHAGAFSQGALIAHLVWLIPFPIVMAMLPKVVQCRVKGQPVMRLLVKSMVLGCVAAGLICVIGTVAVHGLFKVLFGRIGHPMAPVMPMFLAAMFPLAISFVILNYEMAMSRFSTLVPLGFIIAVLVVSLGVHHGSSRAIVGVVCRANWMLLVLLVITCVVNEVRMRKGQ